MSTSKLAISITLPESFLMNKLLNMREKPRKYTGKISLIVLRKALKNTKMSCFVVPHVPGKL